MKPRWFLALLALSLAPGLLRQAAAAEPGPWTEPVLVEPADIGVQPKPVSVWVSSEYLLYWLEGTPLPPLVTTGPLGGRGPGLRPGTLGLPGTAVLVDGPLDFGPASGGRFMAGAWLGCQSDVGVEGGYFFLGERSTGRSLAQPGTPGSVPLSIPFFNARLGIEDSTSLALPDDQLPIAGGFDLVSEIELQGAEANGVVRLGRCGWRCDLLAGFRWLQLDERLRFDTNSPLAPPAAPDVFRTFDRFRTDNDFYGGQFGLRLSGDLGPVFWRATGKVALGNSHQVTHIDGSFVTNFSNLQPTQSFEGGYLALPTNIGRHSRDRFAVVPEANLTVGVQPLPGVRLFADYNFLYLSSVMRPGDQVDRVINPSQAPAISGVVPPQLRGPARPMFPGRDDDFWAHGLGFGLELQF